MTESDAALLQELVSEELSAVTFVRDYIQLQFRRPRLNVYNPVVVRRRGTASRSGDFGYPQALVAQINKGVIEVRRVPSDRLELVFDDGSLVEISLRPDDYVGPEAFEYFGERGDRLIE